MDKVLIFTNSSSIYNVDNNFKREITGEYIELNNNSGILLYSNNCFVRTTKLNSGEIFFLSDTLTPDNYNTFYNTKNQDDTIFELYHLNLNNGGFKLKLLSDDKKHVIGQNIQSESGKYAIALKILLDNEDDKCKRIIDKIFKGNPKLETVLDFLHECWVKIPDDREKLTIAFSSKEIDSIEKLITKMKDSKSESKEYFESFISLRDELLRLAGI